MIKLEHVSRPLHFQQFLQIYYVKYRLITWRHLVKIKTNLIDVFVCFDKVNGELPQGSWSWVTKALGHVPLKYQMGKSQYFMKKQITNNMYKTIK